MEGVAGFEVEKFDWNLYRQVPRSSEYPPKCVEL